MTVVLLFPPTQTQFLDKETCHLTECYSLLMQKKKKLFGIKKHTNFTFFGPFFMNWLFFFFFKSSQKNVYTFHRFSSQKLTNTPQKNKKVFGSPLTPC
jgi:hypothetical protein